MSKEKKTRGTKSATPDQTDYIITHDEFLQAREKAIAIHIKSLKKTIHDCLSRGKTNISFGLYYDTDGFDYGEIFLRVLKKLLEKYVEVGWFISIFNGLVGDTDDPEDYDDEYDMYDAGENPDEGDNGEFFLVFFSGKFLSRSKFDMNSETSFISLPNNENENGCVKIHRADKCVVCQTAQPNILYGCGHLAMCQTCDTVSTCPLCRENIKSRYFETSEALKTAK